MSPLMISVTVMVVLTATFILAVLSIEFESVAAFVALVFLWIGVIGLVVFALASSDGAGRVCLRQHRERVTVIRDDVPVISTHLVCDEYEGEPG